MRLVDSNIGKGFYTVRHQTLADPLVSMFASNDEMLQVASPSIVPAHQATNNLVFLTLQRNLDLDFAPS